MTHKLTTSRTRIALRTSSPGELGAGTLLYNQEMASKKEQRPTIALNKRARHEYALDERFEAGMVLEGWEVKAIRAGNAQLTDSYVLLRDGEAWLLGANVTPLASASTHVVADPRRTRKLLLHARELARIYDATRKKGYACIATAMYWKNDNVPPGLNSR